MDKNSNTSHVTVKPSINHVAAAVLVIQIHPMLRLNGGLLIYAPKKDLNSNTSHVTVKPILRLDPFVLGLYSNTSYVTVKPNPHTLLTAGTNSNTSYVTVKQRQ